MSVWLGQYCLNVSDLDTTVKWYEALGFTCTSRTEIPQAFEAIVENAATGNSLQLAQQKDQDGPIRLGSAFWKLYVNTPDVAKTFAASQTFDAPVVMAPMRVEQWPVSLAFVRDPDGYLVEFVERHPWPDDLPTDAPWFGQYCINVTDLDAAVTFYESLGLVCTSRTEIEQAFEAILENPDKGAKVQLAQQKSGEAIDQAQALWKLYVNTDDVETSYKQALASGATSFAGPERLERWPVTIAFVTDPDGYLIEFVQRDPR